MSKARYKDQEPALFEAPPATKPTESKTQEVTAPAKQSKKSTSTKKAEVKQAKPEPKSKGEVVVMKPREPVNMAAVLLQAAKDADPARARELFALWQETEAKQQFHDALLTVDLPSINKDGMIEARESAGSEKKKPLRFATFDNVHRTIVPLLKQAGFRLAFQPMPGPNGEGLVVECRLIRGLYEERCVVPISTSPASRAMNSQQATGAAIKYASRYGMMALLNLRSEWHEDADLDGNDPSKVKATRAKDGTLELKAAGDEPIGAEQVKALQKAVDDSGINPTRFMEKYEIERLDDLPSRLFDEATKALMTYKAAAQKKKGGADAA